MTVKNTNDNGGAVVAPNFDVISLSGLLTPDSRWCAWAYREREGGGKPAKVPHGVGGRPISVGDADKWSTFDEAREMFSGAWAGVGVLMSSLGSVVGLDLDNCLDPDGSVTVVRETIVEDFLALGGYVEVSPSGRGLRQFVQGARLDGFAENNGDGLEIYDSDSARYLTVTGHVFKPVGLRPIVVNQAGLEAFTLRWGKPLDSGEASDFVDDAGFPVVERSVDEILSMMRQRNKRGAVTKLLNGDVSDYPGRSEADAALAFEAAYYSRDAAVIEAVMHQSKLVRDKWDSKRGKRTYLGMTIANALQAQRRNFDADQAARVAKKTGKAEASAALTAKGTANLEGGVERLMIGGKIRSDVWAASELLLDDRRLLGVLFWDEFSGYPTLTRPLAEVFADRTAPVTVGRLTDCHYRAVACWLASEWGVVLRPGDVLGVVARWAQAVRVNPLVTTLEGFKWDGVHRLDNWLVRYCRAATTNDAGDDISDYVQAVGSRWVLSCVARGVRPGAKADSMLVLEGPQGARKSSAVRVLAEALGPEYFREGFSVGATRSKDDVIALRGRLIVEWAELAGLTRRDANEIKNFLTLQVDAYRAVFGLTETDWPRTAVFAATTNEAHYLNDATGNRRFWPVKVGRIDIDALRRDAPLLWAEAFARYRDGERWWFDDNDVRDRKTQRMAEREQRDRIGGAYWDELAADLADKLVAGTLATAEGVFANEMLKFSVAQMQAWLSAMVEGGGAFDDASWRKACEGLRRAGWDSRKMTGRMCWFLSPERRDELREEMRICAHGPRSMKLAAIAEAVAKQAVDAAKAGASSAG